MGRIQVGAVALLAVAGVARRLIHGNWDAAGAVLLASPIVILVGGNYDGEALFRVFLFALPFAAFFMAQLLYPSREAGRGWITPTVAIGLSAFVLVGFLFAYYGKDSWSYFTKNEVRAAEIVYDHAPPHTLLVEGTHDYPNQFRDAERFTYMTLANEPRQSIEGVLHRPVAKLAEWLGDPRYRQAYLIITRAQKEQINAIGPLPRGSLSMIEQRLLASSKFKVVVRNRERGGVPGRPPRHGHRAEGRYGEPAMTADRWVQVVGLSCALALLATIAATGNAWSMIPLLWFFAVIPGLPYVLTVRNHHDAIAFWLSAGALSVALDALVAEALLYLHEFSAIAVVSVLVIIAWLGAAIGRLRTSSDPEASGLARQAHPARPAGPARSA